MNSIGELFLKKEKKKRKKKATEIISGNAT